MSGSLGDLEKRYHERRQSGVFSAKAVRVMTDVVLALVMVVFTVTLWSPKSMSSGLLFGLKILVPISAVLLILRAIGWTSPASSDS